MAKSWTASEIALVNGSTGDPGLFIDYPGRDDAILFDAGDNARLDADRLGDLGAVFITHHHVDHFIGLDRIVRANLDRDKTLRIYGPTGTIRRVFDRIKSYLYPDFGSMKLVLELHDVEAGQIKAATFGDWKRFPEPEPTLIEWEGPTLLEIPEYRVEAAFADHTVPCLAFALVEMSGFHPDRARMQSGPLRPGPWVGRVLAGLRAEEPADTPIEIDGGRWTLGDLAARYFGRTPGARIAYITDTWMSPIVRPDLLRLAHKATRLYCDAYYASKHLKQAEKYRHMTAAGAAELARDARAESLVLIHFAARYQGAYETLLDEARAIYPAASAEIPAR
ncbi:MBL fold metallo-hydrolase [Tundrisphaera sp. TA3]|uniref:MBL fold metallo-hydrolase n=1 Tax=Tundrisphaera sp. TA3 TaxID=3435775 RepID=UPI003EB99265